MSSFEPTSKRNPAAAREPFVADAGQQRDASFRSQPSWDAHPIEGPEPTQEDAPEPGPAVDPEAIAREAFERGREEGREALPWQDAEALRTAVTALETSCRELDGVRRGYLQDNRTAIVELALAVAERVIGRTLRSDPEVLASVVQSALEELGSGESPVLHLSHPDHDTLRAGLAPALDALCRRHDLAIHVDCELRAGETRLVTAHSCVDARLGEVLRRVREELDPGPEPCESAS